MDIFFKFIVVFLICNFDNIFIFRLGYIKVVLGEGMLVLVDFIKKGDLVIEFDIEFFTFLIFDRKDLIKKAFFY